MLFKELSSSKSIDPQLLVVVEPYFVGIPKGSELLIDASDDKGDAVLKGMVVLSMSPPIRFPVVTDDNDLLMPFEEKGIVLWGDNNVSRPL